MVVFGKALQLLLATATHGVLAHPGHDVEVEVAERQAYFNTRHAKRSLAHCAEHLERSGINKRSLQRRAASVAQLRQDLALKSKKPP